MSIQTTIAKDLLEAEAVKISVDPPFTWASGIKSPIYCDNRVLIAYPEIRETIVSEFIIKIQAMNPDVIAGTATAGIPWAAFVAYKMGLPMTYVRPKPKEHGAGKQIEGHLEPHKKVVLVEDLISTGGSSLKAVDALKNEGMADVLGVVAITTYEMQASLDAFEEAGLPLQTLTTFSYILEAAQEKGYLKPEQRDVVLSFRENPANWWEKFQLEQ